MGRWTMGKSLLSFDRLDKKICNAEKSQQEGKLSREAHQRAKYTVIPLNIMVLFYIVE